MLEDRSPRRHAAAIAVALAAAALVAVLIAASPMVERVITALPGVHANRVGLLLLVASALVLLALGLRRVAIRARDRARASALGSLVGSSTAHALRTPMLRAALDELGGTRARLGRHLSAVADPTGLALWSGGRRPRRAAGFAWREVRSIRSDRLSVGAHSVPIAVVRVRRDGASVDVPLLLSSDRLLGFALADDAFYATIRTWKAEHRAALAAEGLELPPPTAPIPVITPAQLAAAR